MQDDMKVFDYTRKGKFDQLDPEQKVFVAKMITREVERIAKELKVSEDTAYEFYRRGILGSDRNI